MAHRPVWLSDLKNFLEVDAFDFIIIGGGTAGLTVASRLSENPSLKIGVIEAGPYKPNDPRIDDPASWSSLIADMSYTWQMFSSPQESANKRTVYQPTGKLLGGSSNINLMALMRASKQDYDNWEALGNPGWNWEGLLPYFKKTESYSSKGRNAFSEKKVVNNGLENMPVKNEKEYRGTDGPIKASFVENNSELDMRLFEAFNSLGVHSNQSPAAGLATGVFSVPKAVFPDTGKRCSSVTGYLSGVEGRNNCYILTDAHVTRLILETSANSDIRANGVEFLYRDAKYAVIVKKDVIMAAGAINTPQILELSGIGRRDILASQGIACMLELPGVGENYQDHQGVPICVAPKDCSIRSNILSMLAFAPLKSIANEQTISVMQTQLDEIFTQGGHSMLQEAQYRLQRNILGTPIGTTEIIVFGMQKIKDSEALTLCVAAQHPFSRGSVHIQSRDPFDKPKLDPNFLGSPFDVAVLRCLLRFSQKLISAPAVKDQFMEVISPSGFENFERDEQFDEYIQETVSTVFHSSGTAAMAPQEMGGVVDPSLRVYGTQNLRIVDASIFPLHIAAHPLATIYAVAEKAADIIRAET